METIWLQRPSADIPWGFRLQGGREFAEPLSVQRVCTILFPVYYTRCCSLIVIANEQEKNICKSEM